MGNMKQKIFNIPLSASFVDVLATKLLDEFEDFRLSTITIILPSRRACQNLTDAFIRAQGLKPVILPRLIPLGDIEEDELFLTGDTEILQDLAPAVSKMERTLHFVRLIMSKPISFGLEKLSLAQSCFLAQELGGLIDLVNNENLSFSNLKNLAPAEYSNHWQETLKLLEIITAYWPEQLKELGLVDPSFRQNQMLKAQSHIWQKNPPQNKIILAGITATFPAMKELVKTILKAPNSEMYLYGLDKDLDEEDWDNVDESHPQFELKDLLNYLEISRFEIKDISPKQDKDIFVSEIMRPAKTSFKWRDIKAKKINKVEATSRLNLFNCRDIREEALSIAVLMREIAQGQTQTAALVTTDRNLARRVASELERWNIKIDDTAGKPLHLTPIAQFLNLIIEAVENNDNLSFISLLKHPFFKLLTNKEVREYEKTIRLKTLPLDGGGQGEGVKPTIQTKLTFIQTLFSQKETNFKTLIQTHIALAEELSDIKLLWHGEDGEAMANFIAELFDYASILGSIPPQDYAQLLRALMSNITVRPRFGLHPRLKILGPIEARLCHFDTIIIGEVNETMWPQTMNADPWMSRPMKKEFGFPLPEKAVGILAHDFSALLANKEVYLTRADRVMGTPMVKSRWLMRLETVLKALEIDPKGVEKIDYTEWAKFLDTPEKTNKINPPHPTPPVKYRPRELYAGAVETLIRNPYDVFAKYILELKPLYALDKELNFADYGNIVHAILDIFNKKFSTLYPVNAKEELIQIGEKYFQELPKETKAFWWPSFLKNVDWLVDIETAYRADIRQVFSETKGSFEINAPYGKFTISAKADRVDITNDGKVNIIDYKTGQAKKLKEVRSGYAPQLPIEGLIKAAEGYEINDLIYWRLGKEELRVKDDIEKVLETNLKRITKLIHDFDKEETPYQCRPNSAYAPKQSDYDHLARVKEWSVIEEGSDE